MSSVVIETSWRTSAAALAERLRDRPGLFVLSSSPVQQASAADVEASFVGADPVERSTSLAPPDVRDARSWAGRRAAPRWVGLVPYESQRFERASYVTPETRPPPIVCEPCWLRYDAVFRIDHATGVVAVEADSQAAADGLLARAAPAPASPMPFRVGTPSWSDDDEAHASKVRAVLDWLFAGDAYQVNLARRATFAFEGDALAFFAALSRAAPSPFEFFLDAGAYVVAGASPELALDWSGAELRTCPIKGTRARGTDAVSDALLRADLEGSEKERAELTMAVDLHRNDLGKIACLGSVRVLGAPTIVSGRTVMSRIAEVRARVASDKGLAEILEALVPFGSVTGAPKIRAMEIIRALESARRGLYTGVIGTVRRDGGATLAMAIRTAVIDRAEGLGEYFAGGGIVIGSEPAAEALETRWKAEQLLRVSG